MVQCRLNSDTSENCHPLFVLLSDGLCHRRLLDVRQFASLVFHHQQRSLFRSVYYTASAVKSIFIILKTDGRTEHNRVSVFQ